MSTTFHLWLSNLQIAALPRHPRFQASWSNVFHSSFLFFFFIIFLFYHFFIIIIIFAAFDSVVRFCGLLSISCDTCVSFCTECDLGLTEKVLCGLQRFSQIAFEHCKLKPFVCPKKNCIFQGFVTAVAHNWTIFVNHMNFQITFCVFSPIHFVTWLVILLYGIFFPQCLPLNSLWEFMGISNRLSHYHHAHFACASSDVFQKELQSCIWHKEAWRLQICSVGNDALSVKRDDISVPKRKLYGYKMVCFEFGMFRMWGPQHLMIVRH